MIYVNKYGMEKIYQHIKIVVITFFCNSKKKLYNYSI